MWRAFGPWGLGWVVIYAARDELVGQAPCEHPSQKRDVGHPAARVPKLIM